MVLCRIIVVLTKGQIGYIWTRYNLLIADSGSLRICQTLCNGLALYMLMVRPHCLVKLHSTKMSVSALMQILLS